MTTVRVAVLDVGAVRNLGWAALDVDAVPDLDGTWHTRRIVRVPDRGTTLVGLVACVSDALDRGVPVALGFECPGFVPVRAQERALLDQRCGEAGRPSLERSDIDTGGEPAFNLLAAAALRAELIRDVGESRTRAYVVRAR